MRQRKRNGILGEKETPFHHVRIFGIEEKVINLLKLLEFTFLKNVETISFAKSYDIEYKIINN